MRKIYLLVSYLLLTVYIIFSRSQWFQKYETMADTGNAAVFSGKIDLTHSGSIRWEVPRTEWSFQDGESMLSLVLDAPISGESTPSVHSKLPLRLAVSAEGIGKSGEPLDRLVRNWYFTTNEPFDDKAKLWSSFNQNGIEYGLGGVNIYPFERTVITLNIQTPDSDLMNRNPRLKIVGKHDYAVSEVLPLLRVVKNGCFALALGLLFVTFIVGWKHQ